MNEGSKLLTTRVQGRTSAAPLTETSGRNLASFAMLKVQEPSHYETVLPRVHPRRGSPYSLRRANSGPARSYRAALAGCHDRGIRDYTQRDRHGHGTRHTTHRHRHGKGHKTEEDEARVTTRAARHGGRGTTTSGHEPLVVHRARLALAQSLDRGGATDIGWGWTR